MKLLNWLTACFVALLFIPAVFAQSHCAPGTGDYLSIPTPEFDPEYISSDDRDFGGKLRVDRYGRIIAGGENAARSLSSVSNYAHRVEGAASAASRAYWASFTQSGHVSKELSNEYAYWAVRVRSYNHFLAGIGGGLGGGALDVFRMFAYIDTSNGDVPDPGIVEISNAYSEGDIQKMLKLQARLDYITITDCVLFEKNGPDRALELALLRQSSLKNWEYARQDAEKVRGYGLTDAEKESLTKAVYQNQKQAIPGYSLESLSSIRGMLKAGEGSAEQIRLNDHLSQFRRIITSGDRANMPHELYSFPNVKTVIGIRWGNLLQFSLPDGSSSENIEKAEKAFAQEVSYDARVRAGTRTFDDTLWNDIGRGAAPNPYLKSKVIQEVYACAVEEYPKIAHAIVEKYPILIITTDNYKGKGSLNSMSMRGYGVPGSPRGSLAADAFWLAMLSCGSGQSVDPTDRVMRFTLQPYEGEADRLSRLREPDYRPPSLPDFVRPLGEKHVTQDLIMGNNVILDLKLFPELQKQNRGFFLWGREYADAIERNIRRRSSDADWPQAHLTLENSNLLTDNERAYMFDTVSDHVTFK